ncbi:MAG TPA: zf-HC2 domain-containing protein [Planctomycetota bacterium]|nr:zf-HC2 domain-containing protein [Planctomycetota bacterium]
MNCDEIRGLLEEYHDRELSPDRAEPVRSHVAGCAACAGELRGFEVLDRALRSVPAGTDDVRWDRYVERVRERSRPSRRLPWKAAIPVAAAALFVFGFARWFAPGPTLERPLLDRYAAAGPEERRRLERTVADMDPEKLAAIVAAVIADPAPDRRRLAAQLLTERLAKVDDSIRKLLLDRSEELSRHDGEESVLVDIGFEPGDEALVGPALEMARSPANFDDAVRILRRLDKGTLNRKAHAEIVRRLRELLGSDMPRERELAVRLAGDLEILLADVVEFLDVPDLGARVLEFLKRRTGKDVGTDKKAWRDWFAKSGT